MEKERRVTGVQDEQKNRSSVSKKVTGRRGERELERSRNRRAGSRMAKVV